MIFIELLKGIHELLYVKDIPWWLNVRNTLLTFSDRKANTTDDAGKGYIIGECGIFNWRTRELLSHVWFATVCKWRIYARSMEACSLIFVTRVGQGISTWEELLGEFGNGTKLGDGLELMKRLKLWRSCTKKELKNETVTLSFQCMSSISVHSPYMPPNFWNKFCPRYSQTYKYPLDS